MEEVLNKMLVGLRHIATQLEEIKEIMGNKSKPATPAKSYQPNTSYKKGCITEKQLGFINKLIERNGQKGQTYKETILCKYNIVDLTELPYKGANEVFQYFGIGN